MVKKISTFLSNDMRKELAHNDIFRNSAGVKKAFEFPQRVVHACLTRPTATTEDPLEKFFNSGYEQFEALSTAFEKAHRLEVYIDVGEHWADEDLLLMKLEIKLYECGSRESSFWLYVEMNPPSGGAVAAQCSEMSLCELSDELDALTEADLDE